MPRIAYIESLPKKVIGAACVLEDSEGKLLIIKPSSSDGWLVPGGPLKPLESPKAGCIRKTKEELGLEIVDVKLIGVAHSLRRSEEKDRYESIHFIFHGGTLNAEQIDDIFLQPKTFETHKFCAEAEAIELLSFPLDERVRLSLEAMKKGNVAYIELLEE